MSEHLALVKALLTPNLKGSLPIVIMILMIQGIHPEIIFELIPYVQMTHRQYHAIIIAWTQLRLFASLLPAVKGVKHRSFQDQRTRFRIFPQDQVSIVFDSFQKSVLSSMLVRCGFAGIVDVPSFGVIKHFVSKLAVVRTDPSPLFQIWTLFTSHFVHVHSVKTALQMQSMIAHVRSSYPEIVSFLKQNEENALNNIILVWKKQVTVNEIFWGTKLESQEPQKMNILFFFFISAVIDQEFIDESLAIFIKNYEDDTPIPCSTKLLDFLKQNFSSILPISLSWEIGDMCKIVELFCFMQSTSRNTHQVRYTLRPWSMSFGEIVYFGQPEFEELVFDLEKFFFYQILDVFSTFWHGFFRNFARTFAVSFRPFGNIPWSEGYTRLCATNFDLIIRIAVGNFALRIGAKDDHAFLRSKISLLPHSEITSASYGTLIFQTQVERIRHCKISSEICLCFLRDFWQTHRKPDCDPDMSDIDYIRWLFSIPEYAPFGNSWMNLVDSLQNGTELPKIWDGSSNFFSYLSCTISPVDPSVQSVYDRNFRKKDPKISDFFEK